jgi:hypothetical protein
MRAFPLESLFKQMHLMQLCVQDADLRPPWLLDMQR